MQVRYLASAFHYESILQVFAFFIRRLQVRLFYELQTDHIAENLYIWRSHSKPIGITFLKLLYFNFNPKMPIGYSDRTHHIRLFNIWLSNAH